MPRVYIDIECAPSQRPDIWQHLQRKVSPDLDFEAAEVELQRLYRATSLNAAFGEIASIGVALDDRPPKVYWRNLPGITPAPLTRPDDAMLAAGCVKTERDLLLAFRRDLGIVAEKAREPIQLIGLNVREFDRPYIAQRAFVHHLFMPRCITCDVKPWEHHLLKDLMDVWRAGGDKRSKISMRDLAFAMGLVGKGDVDGGDVWQMLQQGRGEEVAIYNCNDVVVTRTIDVSMMTME